MSKIQMNISTIFSHLPQPSVLPFMETTQVLKDFSFLIPTISVIALGIIYASNVPIGIAIGLGTFTVSTVVTLTLHALNLVKEDSDNVYGNELKKNPLLATLAAPFLEEGLFRGILQPWATRVIIALAPTATAAFLGTSLSVATTVAIVASAALFGLIHAFNDHKNSRIQAAIATLGGVILGVTAAQYGIAAAIVAHIVNNTLAMIEITLRDASTATEAGLEFAAVRV